MECLRLKHLVQTVGSLEAVVLRAFGPNGGQVLFTRDTGQAMLSRSGAQILTVLRLDNPLARMIVECASAHSARTGDGSKTFILLLASFVRRIEEAAFKDPPVPVSNCSRASVQLAYARRLADDLLSLSLLLQDDLMTAAVFPGAQPLLWQDINPTSSSPIQKLFSAFFLTRLGYNYCSFVSRLLCEMLCNWTSKNNQPFSSLQFVNDIWPALFTPVIGFPLIDSKLVEGQVIHRDFATPFSKTHEGPIKAVVLDGYLHPQFLAGEVLEIRDNGSVLDFSSFAESYLRSVFTYLKSLGVSLLLSSVKQPVVVLTYSAQAQIHVVECIDQEELALFRHLSGATPVSDCRSIESKHVVQLEFCKPIYLGAHSYVHVGFPDKQTIKPCSLVICGAGEAQTEQLTSAMHDAVRMLMTTWQPLTIKSQNNSSTDIQHKFPQGYVIAAGGTFEFVLSHALQQGRDVDIVLNILVNSLLCVPKQIYSQHPRHFTQIQSKVMKLIHEHSTATPSENSSQLNFAYSTSDSGLESIFCKFQLILEVLQCVSRLFRIDTVLHIHSRLKTIGRTNISCEDLEDEDDNWDCIV